MNTVTKIRSIKADIKNSEASLNIFMDMDLSDSAIRGEMRKVLATIEALESSLSDVLAAA